MAWKWVYYFCRGFFFFLFCCCSDENYQMQLGDWQYLESWEQQTWGRRKQDMGCQEKYISVTLIWRFWTHLICFKRGKKANQNGKQRQLLNSVSEKYIFFTSNFLWELNLSEKLCTFNHELLDNGAVYGWVTVSSIPVAAYFQWNAKCSSYWGLFTV